MPPVGKIAKLPAEIRAWLHKAIVDRGFGDIVALTEELNAMCKAGGVAISVGKSAVGVESQRVRRAQESIRAATEAARVIAETSPDDGDSRSAAAMAIVQAEVFDLLLQVRESEDITDPVERLGVMNDAALGLSRLSRARVNQARWHTEVQAKAKAASDAVARIARTGGLSAAQVAEIRSQILGIVKRPPAPGAGAA